MTYNQVCTHDHHLCSAFLSIFSVAHQSNHMVLFEIQAFFVFIQHPFHFRLGHSHASRISDGPENTKTKNKGYGRKTHFPDLASYPHCKDNMHYLCLIVSFNVMSSKYKSCGKDAAVPMMCFFLLQKVFSSEGCTHLYTR